VNSYKCLNCSDFSKGQFRLTPIRFEDRFEIMKWRNEQIYHLRQSQILTELEQDNYFNNVVSNLFDQERPDQILFSFLRNEECIGYGGLVHINWVDKNAEISFIMKTELEQIEFSFLWSTFLFLIEKPAFIILGLNKIYTYAFDIRPHLYHVLEEAGFQFEARIKEHIFFDGKEIDVLVHSKLINNVELSKAIT